ncbi:MAG: helix-hairpin-helix domain-containing protein [Deltaproteobacteria bacterium]|nr:helix-hairpin-helix domain-containing protein [Deltaproteobacteria bacterium]
MTATALPAVDCVPSGGAGTLTARQKYLLGRKVDINRAGTQEISGLPGISDAVALSVVETRNRIGGFRRAEDLLLARGIKEKRLKKILPFLAGFHNN